MITGECQCADQCGRPADLNGPPGMVYSAACWRRWNRAGSPPEGVAAVERQPVTGVCECAEWCGRIAVRNGPGGIVLAKSCYQRWERYGKPEVVPPASRKADVKLPEEVPEPDAEPDPVELAARWGWVDPQLRRDRAVPAAAALVRCVQAKDRAGVEIVTSRCTDWGAMMVVLAEVADPVKVAGLTGTTRVEAA